MDDELRDRLAAAANGNGGPGGQRDHETEAKERMSALIEAQLAAWEEADDDERPDIATEGTALIVDTLTRTQQVVQAAARQGVVSPAGAKKLLQDTYVAAQMALAIGPHAHDDVDPDRIVRMIVEGPESVYEGDEGADDEND